MTQPPPEQPGPDEDREPTRSIFEPSYDDQRRDVPGSPGQEHTTVLPPVPSAAPPDARAQRRRGLGVGTLVGALVLGAGGGLGGAAAYDALNDDGTAAVSGTGSTTQRTVTRTSGSGDARAADGSAEAVAAGVLPSVVRVNVTGADGAGSGSGIVLSEDGEILTNEHVVAVAQGGGEITVNFNDGSGARAEIVGTDPVTDLAVIQAENVSGLTPAVIGDSDALDVGEGVVAIGSPFGLEATVTSGIVSALNRPVSIPNADQGVPEPGQPAVNDSTTYPAIQTDAAINPGNSGGPLVNLAGEVVGINSSIRTSTSSLGGEGGSIGLGFAIPISRVLPIVDQLRNGETPTHAKLGVTVSTNLSQDGLVTGAGIEDVTSGSAADEAGLQQGDVVTRVDDIPVTSVEGLVATIRGYRPGDTVELTVVREGETQTIEATLDSDAEQTD